MTKKKKIIIICIAVLAVTAAGLAAGFYAYINRYDAGDYVQAVLDVSYKGKTGAYVEMTGVSEEEAKAVFEDNLDATMEGFDASDMPEELRPQYRELFGELAESVNYTVGEPERQEGGGYTVNVKVKPVTLFSDTYDTFQQKAQEYADQITDSVMQGGEMPTEEEMQKQVYQIYYDVLREALDKGSLYGEVKDVFVRVKKTGLTSFEANEEDMDFLDSLLIEDAQAEQE
ncbi:MAG TPA: hypothetical protein H9732_04235 [Candidatus Mediterraneibacter avicola]|nr:hypothetical protein [Candidatus Mediterraneibacter avicola]